MAGGEGEALTTLGMAADEVAARGDALDLGPLVGLLLHAEGRLALLVVGVGGVGDVVGQRTGGALLHDHAAAVLGIQGEQVAPHALLDLVLDLVRQGGVGIDILREGLGVLGRRRQALGEGVIAGVGVGVDLAGAALGRGGG